MSSTLFVGTCVMWAIGAMLFDYLRRMKPRALHDALIVQGAIFGAMCIANIWLRKKSLALQYEFLFGDVHAFAAYLVLQVALLLALWRARSGFAVKVVVYTLFAIYSLLIVASYSRTGLTVFFVMICIFVTALAVTWL